MKLRVLGCSGGIGEGRHTTSLLIDDDVLIDAGSGVMRLSREQLRRIEHVFITHTHLDHILALPLLLDSVAGEREQPVVVHALPEVIEILQAHLFNWRLWPDFSRLPSEAAPFMRYVPLLHGETLRLGVREFTAVPVRHVVPACGYLLKGAAGSLLFSGDTASHPLFWQVAHYTPDLRHVLVECSFVDAQAALAEAAQHYHPAALAPDVAALPADLPVWISHLKPGSEEAILVELDGYLPGRFRRLHEDLQIEI
jgi:ribonuclease BN (tRNA processing enzyme)